MIIFAIDRRDRVGRRQPRPAPKVGRDGKFELGERLIPDPLEPGQHYRAAMNVRESVIEHMLAHGRIDRAQAEAGARFRRLWELAAIGRQHGVDFSGAGCRSGKVDDPISDELVYAGGELAKVLFRIGIIRSRILVSVVGEGRTIEQIAQQWSRSGGIVSGKRAEGYVSGTLIDAINELVRLWQLKAIGRPKFNNAAYKRKGTQVQINDAIVSSGPLNSTGPANEITVGKHGETAVTRKRGLDRGPLTMHIANSAEVASRNRKRRRNSSQS